MPYVPHLLATFQGTLGTNTPAPEEFSFGVRFLPTIGNSQAMADALRDLGDNLFQDADAHIHTAAQLAHVKCSNIDASGHVSGPVYRNDTEPTSGTSTAVLHPFQDSLVVSLRTGLRGPSHRGRFYLPLPALVVDPANGEYSDVTRIAIEGAVHTFLAGFTSTAAIGGYVKVASRRGYLTQVTGFNIGRVLDTQRRRRRSLDEHYGDLVAIPTP